jgi:hypothetical protein
VTKPLKASGFLGLATMMTVGLYQFVLLSGGEAVPGWMVGAHAHLGVISILAIVVGFAVPALAVTGRLRTAVTGLFVAGQWGIPAVIWLGEGAGITAILPTVFLWGGALILSMLVMLYATVTGPSDRAGGGPTGASTADG